jgi:hypothetical protein
MMSAVSTSPLPGQPPDGGWPTAPLPQIGGHDRNRPDRTRWFMWVAVAGALIMTVIAVVIVTGAGSDNKPLGSAPADPSNTFFDSATSSAPDPTTTDPPSVSASSFRRPKPSPRPAQLIAALNTTVAGLIRDGQLSRDGGADLTKRLREAGERLAKGEVDKAREKLAEFADKVVNLRTENKLSSGGYQTLVAELTRLARALPSR